MKNQVLFENTVQHVPNRPKSKATSVYARFLIKMGVVKTEKSANLLLIVLTVAFFVLAVWIFMRRTTPPPVVDTGAGGNVQNLPPIFKLNR